MIKIIAAMPGAGAVFLSKLMEQSHLDVFLEDAYTPTDRADRRTPINNNWITKEITWVARPNARYNCQHILTKSWLRITVLTHEEWEWACSNALWKNSKIEKENLASNPALPADNYISLQALWSWHSLEKILPQLQSTPVNKHQQRLWELWRETWSPHTHNNKWKKIFQNKFNQFKPMLDNETITRNNQCI